MSLCPPPLRTPLNGQTQKHQLQRQSRSAVSTENTMSSNISKNDLLVLWWNDADTADWVQVHRRSSHRRRIKGHCKHKQRRTFRPKSPSQNAKFLQYLAETGFGFDNQHAPTETQAVYDSFYAEALNLLNSFYPERTITVSSRDPSYMTPEIKAKLRTDHTD